MKRILSIILVICMIFALSGCESGDYKKAVSLLASGEYDEAIALFEKLGDYEDSAEKLKEAKYAKAFALFEEEKYEEAAALFKELGDYEDSARKINEIRLITADVGATVSLGRYYQDDHAASGKADIEWIVLAKEDNKLLLISKYCLDCRKYYSGDMTVTWEDCSLRKWLNNTFFEEAFGETEQKAIVLSELTNPDNPDGAKGGNNTSDKVFALSVDEAEAYFPSDTDRQAQSTLYAALKGASAGDSSWWLRSPGFNFLMEAGLKMGIDTLAPFIKEGSTVSNLWAARVSRDGSIDSDGTLVVNKVGVRPALRLDIGQYKAAVQPHEAVSEESSDPYVVGMYTSFGKYEQDNDAGNGQEDIDWIIMDKKGTRVLLVSRYALDVQPYNTDDADVTWETCTLRAWLNDTFLHAAFSEEEQDRILLSELENPDNPKKGTPGGNKTADKVFLLSIDEANQYFPDESALKVWATDYAYSLLPEKTRGRDVSWWLRSPGGRSDLAVGVSNGRISDYFSSVNSASAVRPAMWISIVE